MRGRERWAGKRKVWAERNEEGGVGAPTMNF